jgi:beta-lactamase class A
VSSQAQKAVEEAVESFAAHDPGRSVAAESLRGTDVSASVRADVLRPAASVLKLLLVAAVHTAARAGSVDLGARVKAGSLDSSCPSVLGTLDHDHELSVVEVCAPCLSTSDNAIAEHLIGLVGFAAANREAAQLGCADTRMEVGFGDGFLGDAGRGNITTASDALRLVSSLITDSTEIRRALSNSLRNTRIPLRLPLGVRAPHKTGTLPGVANDAGVVLGARTDVAVAFLCDGQLDTARTSIDIGDCVARIRLAVGETVASSTYSIHSGVPMSTRL